MATRRKFNIQSEVSMALRRYQLKKDQEWNTKLDRSIVTIICQAYRDKFLFVNGSEIQYFIPIYNVGELLEHLKVLPEPEAIQKPLGRRMKSIPLFCQSKLPTRTSGAQTEKVKVPIAELMTLYKWAENHHKRTELHHPDGLGWGGGIPATIECVFDVFNSLLRTHTLRSAYAKLFQVLASSKFEALDIQGIFYAFLHISIRGVSNTQQIFDSANWRRNEISQDTLFKVCQDFSVGLQPRSLISAYYYETQLHANLVRQEIGKLRLPDTNHDHTKFDPRMVYAYAWHWGVYQRFEDVNKYRFNAGIYKTVPKDVLTMTGSPTMFSLGSSFAQGATSSPAMTELMTLLKQLPQQVSEAINDSVEKISGKLDTTLDSQQSALLEKAEAVIEKAAVKQEQVGADILDKIVEKSTIIGNNMFKSLEPAVESLKTFTSLIEDVINRVASFLSPIPGFSSLKLNAKTIMDALYYYIMYINTESTALRAVMVILILNTFGLLKTAFTEILSFWSWLHETVELDGEEVPAGETTGFFSWLSDSPHALVQLVGGLMASMTKGAKLTSKEFLSLAKKLADTFKNFHFISQGISGITRIFDYVKKAYTTVVEWISEHIFGKTPEREEFALETTRLSVKIRYLHSEAGLNAIRMSESVRDEAAKLMPRYLGLMSQLRSKQEYRQMYYDLDKLNRQVKEISDFVTRLNNISNFQPTMFHIQFVGRPGIGKSTITKNVVSDLSKSLWPNDSKPSFYSYNTDLEYFDGYAGQKVMIVDDLYKINDPKHLTASMFLVTNTPVILPMANLNDKGVQLTSEVLLTSTNTAYPIGKDVLCMEAIHRRRHMLCEVVCDPDVLDASLGQFSLALFKEKYPDNSPDEFPHLTFNLLRPVPKEFGGAALGVTGDEFEIFKDYAESLKTANYHIAFGDRRLDPTYYFSEENKPPPGITLPAIGWTYQQFISNCVVRFRAFRGAEGSYTTQDKYAHVENCLAEVDMLLDQHNDVPDGSEIAINKIIEDLFCRAQHPYGSQDPIGRRLFERKGNPAPELDGINIDEVINQAISEDAPTMLTTEQERERTANILRRRNRTVADPILNDMLKIETIDGRKVIQLSSYYVGWHKPQGVNSENVGMWFAALKTAGFLNQVTLKDMPDHPNTLYILYRILKDVPRQGIRDWNNMIRWMTSTNMYYPDSPEFAESIRGTDTKFPISFFKDMRKINGRWYLDVTDIELVDGLKPQYKITMTPYVDGPEYQVTADIALMLSVMPTFMAFVREFDCMTVAQQDALVQDAIWRNSYTGTYTYERVLNDCTNIFTKLGYRTLHYCTNPFRYIAEKYPTIIIMVSYFVVYFACIYTIRTISGLFDPKPTSKVLHRAPQASLVSFGRPTAQEQAVCQFSRSIADKNVREIVISNGFSGYRVQALASEQYIICNKHAFRYITDDTNLKIEIRQHGRNLIGYAIKFSNVWMDPDCDLAIIHSPSFPSARKISQHLINDFDFDDHDIGEELVFVSQNEGMPVMDHHRVVKKVQHLQLRNQNYNNMITRAILVQGMTAHGRSGSTVMTWRTNRPKIVGIQAWEVDTLYSPKIAIQVLTSERYEYLQKMLHAQLGYEPVKREVELENTIIEGYETAAEFQQVPAECLVSRAYPAVGLVGRSLIKPSIIFDQLGDLGIVSKSCPAALNPNDPRLYHGKKIHPLAHSIGKYFRGNIEPFNISIMNYAQQQLSKYIASRLDRKVFRVLSLSETITGTREDGSNPMNLKSSPGLPFIHEKHLRGKRDYMHIDEMGDLAYIDPEFEQGYSDFLSLLRQRRLPFTCSYDFPKDELRPIDKALGTETTVPKTRSVTCMNVYFVMAWRQILLDFWASMHRAADGTFSFCPGMNPEGPDWNNAYHYLNRHPNAVDFDITNWDGHLRSDLFLSAIAIVKNITNLSIDDVNVVDTISFEVINSFIQYGSIIYTKDRGILSGFPGTAEINTLSHWLLILYIYLNITKNTIYNTFASFIKHVSVLIYGDDIIITFSEEIAHIFNGGTIEEEYLRIGYPVTAASKSGNIEHSKKLSECTFLKSTWREIIPNYFIRKIDESVIENLVLWVRAKQDPVDQFYDNYLDALWLAFSNGKECFERFQKTINQALLSVSKDIIVFDYIDFERDYYKRYLPSLYSPFIEYNHSISSSCNIE
ncbi:MAG: RNA helicase [Guiyang polycipivirus 2]|nr:MAG: RNA helicase [Guiyang polycipivirus 2]